jgi:hypothetical protein
LNHKKKIKKQWANLSWGRGRDCPLIGNRALQIGLKKGKKQERVQFETNSVTAMCTYGN